MGKKDKTESEGFRQGRRLAALDRARAKQERRRAQAAENYRRRQEKDRD